MNQDGQERNHGQDGGEDATLSRSAGSPVTPTEFLDRLEAIGQLGDKEIASLREQSAADVSSQATERIASRLVESKRLTPYQARHLVERGDTPLRLGNYVILDEVGRGGMGQVYLARHRRMRRKVALKILPPDSLDSRDMQERFQREVEAAAKLSHPNVVAAHDADEADGVHFLVMEYVAGSDLGSLVKRDGPLCVAKAVDYVIQAAQGIAAAHRAGVIHRDIKPSNLIVDESGTVKVVDFGLARLQSTTRDHHTMTRAQLTNTSTLLGTVDFLAPEQARNIKNADHRADIYSLGCTLFYLLSGKPMFPGKSMMAKVTAHQKQLPPSLMQMNQDIPESLDLAYQRMVAKEPSDRFQTMDDVLKALRPLAPADDNSAKPLATSVSTRWPSHNSKPRFATRRHVILGGVALTIVAAICFRLILPGDSSNGVEGSSLSGRETPGESDESTAGGRFKAPEVTASDSRRTFRIGSAPGMLSTLSDAMAAAEAGDTIEIHTNDPLLVEPGKIVWDKGSLTIRAGEGFSPILARQDGVEGKLLQFYPPDPTHEIRLQGLAIINVSKNRPEHHLAIFVNSQLSIDRCLFVSYSGGIYCRNATHAIEARITDSYIANYWTESGHWPTLSIINGRMILENTLMTGRAFVEVSQKDAPAELVSTRCSFINSRGVTLYGTSKVNSVASLFVRSPSLLATGVSGITSLDDFREHLTYSGTRNSFFQTPYRVNWWEDGAAQESEADDLSMWQELTGNNEVDPVLSDPLFVTPNAVQLASNRLLPPDMFELQQDSPTRQRQIGADLSKIPPLPSELHRVLPVEIYDPGESTANAVSVQIGTLPFTPQAAADYQIAWSQDNAAEKEITTSTGVRLNLIPPGTFEFTRAANANVRASEPMQITLTEALYLSTTEITVNQFQEFVDASDYVTDAEHAGGSQRFDQKSNQVVLDAGKSWRDPGYDQGSDHPVVCISWNDASAYCRWLSKQEGRPFRLPTEAEWEWAAHAGSTGDYFFGNDPTQLGDYSICAKSGHNQTASVTLKSPNAWGIHGTLGNVQEWVSDDASYYNAKSLVDPFGAMQSEFRIRRGGAYGHDDASCIITRRHYWHRTHSKDNIGFRVASPLGMQNADEVRVPAAGPDAEQ